MFSLDFSPQPDKCLQLLRSGWYERKENELNCWCCNLGLRVHLITKAVKPEPKLFWMAGGGAKYFFTVETEPEIWVPVQASSTNNTMFFLVFGPYCPGTGAKK